MCDMVVCVGDMVVCGMNRIIKGYMILFRGIWLKLDYDALAFQPPYKIAPKKSPQKKSPRKKSAAKKSLDNQRKICYTKFLGRHQRALRDLG